MTKRFNRWLLMLIVLVAVPFWWLLIDSDRSGAPAKPVHIADLRTLAAIIPGRRPTAVTVTVLATRLAVGDVYASGIGLKRRPLAIITWSLPVPDKGPIVIDPGVPPDEGNLGEFDNIDDAKLAAVIAETSFASLTLHTQGHVSPPPAGSAARASYRLGGKAGIVRLAPPASPAPPPSFTTAQAVAPGVVVIPASGYSPDARLIFVQLADGREFLFTGDIATLAENWSQLRLNSRLAAHWGPPRDQAQTLAWLRTIRQLRSEAPMLQIVPGHDYVWVSRALVRGTIADMQFIPPPAPVRRKPR